MAGTHTCPSHSHMAASTPFTLLGPWLRAIASSGCDAVHAMVLGWDPGQERNRLTLSTTAIPHGYHPVPLSSLLAIVME